MFCVIRSFVYNKEKACKLLKIPNTQNFSYLSNVITYSLIWVFQPPCFDSLKHISETAEKNDFIFDEQLASDEL